MRATACALALAACLSSAWGAPAKREPRVGYLFPAGGRRGTTFEIIVGGQNLRGATDVHVSGQGVRATVMEHFREPRVIYGDEREELVRQLVALRKKLLVKLPGGIRVPPYPGERRRPANARTRVKAKKEGAGEAKDDKPVELPKHPLLRNLEGKSLRELQHIANVFLDYENRLKKQQNVQIAEMVLLKVEVDADAATGCREMRLGSPLGITNPMAFHISALPEAREIEPNDPEEKYDYLPEEAPLATPVVLNGQVMPGDVDRFRFKATRGQRLVIETYARRLIPFLADAVPGWFQATVALYDAKGRELAFADDYRFHPDPVLLYDVPENGIYTLEIRDAIYRGREDFVYRVAVGEFPFITQVFPLGGRAGEKTVATVDGWNLPAKRLKLDTTPDGPMLRRAALSANGVASNSILYAVGTLPESADVEPNNDAKHAQTVSLPLTLNGRIDRPGDVDVFRFQGRAGDAVVADVLARRLHSPLDSVLKLTDAAGRVLVWSDDHTKRDAGYLHPDMGLLTHHADSHLTTRLPKDGTYFVRLGDAQSHGGDAYAYRLRISAPRPDFELRVTPASLNMRAGQIAPITVHALRRDGFQGEIDVALAQAPEGFVLTGARIPAGCDRVTMTLAIPPKALAEPAALRLSGSARINGETVSRPVLPAEDTMQAFLFRHLAPSQEMRVSVGRGWGSGTSIKLTPDAPVRIPVGGAAQVAFGGWRQPASRKIELELVDPPKGLALQDVKSGFGGLTFQLTAKTDTMKAGLADNAIVEIFTEYELRRKDGKKTEGPPEMRRASLGILPAVPFVIVPPEQR